MGEEFPSGCEVEAWRPPGIEGVSEVFHARIADYGYPDHCHDTWTVLIVDSGAISYKLDSRQHGAAGQTVAILPPGVIHNGRPAAGAEGFVKRVLYLDGDVLPAELVGPAVDGTSIDDPGLRAALVSVHEGLVIGADPFAASVTLALVLDRIHGHLRRHASEAPPPEAGIAEALRSMLDAGPLAHVTLAGAAEQLGRSRAHLVRSFSAQYGVAPHAYLIGKRVEKARKLLLAGESPAEVATVVGFYDQSHFTRHFKRHTSLPPAAYATSHVPH